MKKYIDKAEPMCYNSLKPMKRRSRLKPDFPASCGRCERNITDQHEWTFEGKRKRILRSMCDG